MNTQLREPSQEEIDAGLEREIQSVHSFAMKYVDSDPALAREAFSIMARLIAKRSKAQVEKIERAKGLRS